MATRSVASSFTPGSEYLAYSGFDGTIKVWETKTGNLISDFSPSKHLAATCTCLQWGPGRHLRTPQAPKKKKRRKAKETETAVDNLQLIAVGTSSGAVLLYSFSKGMIHTHLEKGHTDAVTDLCWDHKGTTLYSSSLDGHIVEWDVVTSQLKQKWKASTGSVNSMCLCSSNRLLTADHVIKMWDLTNRTLIRKFTGHSTEVFRLLAVPTSQSNDDNNGEFQCSYFLSAAVNDRVINAWNCDAESKEKNAITSFSLSDEPVDFHLRVSPEKVLTLAILTVQGKVLIFEHTLNGKLKKPLQPLTVVHAATQGSKDDASVTVPIVAATPIHREQPRLLVAHGQAFKPTFESVVLKAGQPEIVLVVPGVVKKTVKQEFTVVKTPDASGGSVLYPSQMVPQGPGKRKRKQSASELTLEDRLQAMGSDKPRSSGEKRPPRADQLVVQLTQGLQSKDGLLLMNAFQEKSEDVIRNTIQRLPLNVITPLTKEVCQRLQGHPQNGLVMIRWFKLILAMHMSYLMTVPEVMESLEEVYQMINYRTQSFPQRISQQGRLHMLLSRVASQNQEEEPSASAEALLVYQDESSDELEDVPLDMGASESEDNWTDMD